MENNMNKITQKRFDAYLNYIRHPFLQYIGKEIEWYENKGEYLWATIILDFKDNNYSAVIFGRDENKQVRCIKVTTSLKTIELARVWISEEVSKIEKLDKKVYPQGESKKGVDLFKPIVKESKEHPYFKILNEDSAHEPAKILISEIMHNFFDIDGNFVQQFQTTGFDARIWELYLFSYFKEIKLNINKDHHAPDFLLSDIETTVSVEATIVGRKTCVSNVKPELYTKDEKVIKDELMNKIPIMYGSPLYSKLKHKDNRGLHYWEYQHTENKPFVIAIADFHDDSSAWTMLGLIEYLYACRVSINKKNGNIIFEKIDKHVYEKKVIPSGFFYQKDSENVSAILYSNAGTIAKFNRLGKQCGFDENNIIMIRNAEVWTNDFDKTGTKRISYKVTERSEETWSDGIIIFHNPNAKQPLSKDFFKNSAQFFYEHRQILAIIPEGFSINSSTIICKGY